MNKVRWVIPEAAEPEAGTAAPTGTATGAAPSRKLRIGLLDNTKDNARLLLDLVSERVRAEVDAEFIVVRKGNATLGATVEMLDELASESDCVVTAMAD
jgi:hypothetical protein